MSGPKTEYKRENIEYETEKIARRLSKELQDTEALWQMYLHDAYEEYFRLKKERK